jgi:hypothetical protein
VQQHVETAASQKPKQFGAGNFMDEFSVIFGNDPFYYVHIKQFLLPQGVWREAHGQPNTATTLHVRSNPSCDDGHQEKNPTTSQRNLQFL